MTDPMDERRLRDLLERSFAEEEPSPELWTATKRRVRRREARRRAGAVTSALGVLVIAAFAAPALLDALGTRSIEFVSGPDAAESPDDASAEARRALTEELAAAEIAEQKLHEALEASPGPARLHAVAAGGPGLVAVGSRPDEATGIWTSSDGVRWHESTAADGETFGGLMAADVEVAAVAGAEPVLVAFAREAAGPPRFWVSADGRRWAAAAADPEVFAGATVMDVTAGGPGLVAVGFEGDPTEISTLQSAVWVSTDGSDWQRVPDASDEYDEDVMEFVVEGGPGLVAVGTDARGAHVWTSADGYVWERDRPHLETRDGIGLRVVALGPTGREVVAVAYARSPGMAADRADSDRDEADEEGAEGEESDAIAAGAGFADAFLLRSQDGRGWTDTWLPPEIFARLAVRGIAELDGRLVVAGEDAYGAVLWESSDGGQSWTLVEGVLTALEGMEPIAFPDSLAELTDGDIAYGVYVSVGHSAEAAQLANGVERLRAAGFAGSVIDLACDAGAFEQLELDEDRQYFGAPVYFSTDTDAWRFVTAWKRQFRVGVVGVALVERGCPD